MTLRGSKGRMTHLPHHIEDVAKSEPIAKRGTEGHSTLQAA